MDSFSKAKEKIEGGKENKGLDKKKQEYVDLLRTFNKVFDNDEGAIILKHLEKYSHHNFPNYDNVNATYSKIGEQTLVDYINSMIRISKQK